CAIALSLPAESSPIARATRSFRARGANLAGGISQAATYGTRSTKNVRSSTHDHRFNLRMATPRNVRIFKVLRYVCFDARLIGKFRPGVRASTTIALGIAGPCLVRQTGQNTRNSCNPRRDVKQKEPREQSSLGF